MQKKHILTQLVVVILVFLMAAGAAAQALNIGDRVLQMGVTGGDVAMLQVFLNDSGFWAGPVDGIFGPLTRGGVVAFQKQHNLEADGIVGTETAEAINRLSGDVAEDEAKEVVSHAPSLGPEFVFSAEELELLARLVEAEAGGESFEGQVAVAATVLNRIKSDLYPDTLAAVIYQVVNGCYQYSPVLDGRINLPASDSARRAVQEAINGVDPSGGATGFFNPTKTTNAWVRSRPVLAIIGGHIFFK